MEATIWMVMITLNITTLVCIILARRSFLKAIYLYEKALDRANSLCREALERENKALMQAGIDVQRELTREREDPK